MYVTLGEFSSIFMLQVIIIQLCFLSLTETQAGDRKHGDRNSNNGSWWREVSIHHCHLVLRYHGSKRKYRYILQLSFQFPTEHLAVQFPYCFYLFNR